MSAALSVPLPPPSAPKVPYRGIKEFRYIDEPIFFGRKDERRELFRLVAMYRGVLLFGDSGAGKSSLINAGLIPTLVREHFAPERIRIQPKLGEEFIVEHISTSDGGNGPFLPSLFESRERRVTVSAENFVAKIANGDPRLCTLLIFDQFEEVVTLSEQAVRDGNDPKLIERARESIVVTLMTLLRREDLSLKMLFVFREDYYAKLSRFFAGYPNLNDRAYRLEPLRTDDLRAIIRGPFERSGIAFEKPLPESVLEALELEFRERTKTDLVSLTEVQIACMRLWNAKDPAALLASQHVNGLLESYFSEATEAIPPSVRPAAVSLLVRLVTSSGTRNVVSRDTLLADAARDKVDKGTAEAALHALEETAGVIRREARNDVVIYELVSEFLVPWIRRKRIEARVGERERKWIRAFAASCGVGLLITLGLGLMVYRRSNSELSRRLVVMTARLDAMTASYKALRANGARQQAALRAEVVQAAVLKEKADEQRIAAEKNAAQSQLLVQASIEALQRRLTWLTEEQEINRRQIQLSTAAMNELASDPLVRESAADSESRMKLRELAMRMHGLLTMDVFIQENVKKTNEHLDILRKKAGTGGASPPSPSRPSASSRKTAGSD